MANLATITTNILADSGIDDINVVVTTGSYSNPAWITALAFSKITGVPSFQLTSEKGQPNGYASLDSNGKVPLVQINDALIGNVNFQGLWNAATNTPTLVNPPAAGTKGYYYIVSTGGTFAGITFEVGDWIISNGSAWGKVDNTDAVSSVFGRTGNVVAANGDYTTAQVTESGNLYYTDARSRAALSFSAGSGAYNTSTGVITIPTDNNQIANSAGYITSAALSGYVPTSRTITINGTTQDLSANRTFNVGTVTSVTASSPIFSSGGSTPNITIQQAGASASGFLSNTDWNTFNNKQNTISLTTTGTSGVATLIGTTLNIPNYGGALSGYLPLTGGTLTGPLGGTSASFSGDVTANRYRGVNSLVLNSYTTVNPSSNVYLYSPPSDRDAWIYLDSADTGSNWGIYHRQIDSAVSGLPANSIGFVGGGSSTLQAWISLANGNGYYAGNLLVGNNSDNGARLQVSGTGVAFNFTTSNGLIGNINSSAANGGYVTWQTSGTTIADLGTAQQVFGAGGNDTFGINARGARSLILGTNNTGRLTIDSTGAATFSSSVGIGGSPVLRLDVQGNAADTTTVSGVTVEQVSLFRPANGVGGIRTGFNTSTGDAYLFSSNSGSSLNFGVRSAPNNTAYLSIAYTGAATFSSSVTAAQFLASSSSNAAIITSTGTTGYGLVAVGSAGGARDIFLAGQSGFSNGFTVQYTGTEMRYTFLNGNVGIGTPSPNRLLTIKNSIDGVNGISFQNYASTSELGYIRYEQTNDFIDIVNNSAFAGGGIKFSTNGSPRMTITSGGNVLIGTTTDSGNILRVNGNSWFDGGINPTKTAKNTYAIQIRGSLYGAPRLQVYDLNADPNGYMGLGTDMSGAPYEFSNYFPRTGGNGRWSVGSWAGDFGTGQYVSGYNEKLFITESAAQFNTNLGIGVSPATNLHVQGASVSYGQIRFLNSSSSGEASIHIGRTNQTLEQRWTVGQGVAGIGDSFGFYTGGSSRVSLQTNGNVLIGTTSDNGNRLRVNGTIFSDSSITATSFFESSDATLKTLIQDNYQAKGIDSVVAKLYIKNGKQELGYFAQDLQDVLPSAVSKGSDGLLNLSYREVHTAKIAYLEERIKQLEKKYENN